MQMASTELLAANRQRCDMYIKYSVEIPDSDAHREYIEAEAAKLREQYEVGLKMEAAAKAREEAEIAARRQADLDRYAPKPEHQVDIEQLIAEQEVADENMSVTLNIDEPEQSEGLIGGRVAEGNGKARAKRGSSRAAAVAKAANEAKGEG